MTDACPERNDEQYFYKHAQIVRQLRRTLEALQRGDTSAPRVVLLSGHSGVGKTHIVRKLYSELSRDDDYWPDFEHDRSVDSARKDPLATRKLIYPAVEGSWRTQKGSLPTFGWWGINCETSETGAPADVLAALRTQWELHSVPLRFGLLKALDVRERVSSVWDAVVKEAGDSLAGEGADLVWETAFRALGGGALGSGAVLDLLRKGIRAILKRAKDQRSLSGKMDRSSIVWKHRASIAQELADLIAALAHPKLPAIVVIEDMHRMGAGLAEFINNLCRQPAQRPVLVIGTVWPEAYENNAYENEQFVAWRSTAIREGFMKTELSVPELDTASLAKIVQQHFEHTTDEVAERIAVAFGGNPLFLKLWLTSKNVQNRLNGTDKAALMLDGPHSVRIPKDATKVIDDRWRQLHSETQKALIDAVVANPRSHEEDPTAEFPREIIHRVLVEVEDLEAPRAALMRSIDPARWCSGTADPAVQTFTESLLAQVARTKAKERRDEQFNKEDWFIPLRERLTDALEEWLLKNRQEQTTLPDGQIARLVSRWYLGLTDRGGHGLGPDLLTAGAPLPDDFEASERPPAPYPAGLAYWHLAEDAFAGTEAPRGTLLGEAALSAFQEAGLAADVLQEMRWTLVTRLGQAREYELAAQKASAILADLLAVRSEEEPETLEARFRTVWWQGAAGDAAAASDVLSRIAEKLDKDDDNKFFTSLVGEFDRWTGLTETTAEQLLEKIDEYSTRLGDVAHHTIDARRDFVNYAYAHNTGFNERGDQLGKLLDAELRVFGVSDPRTIESIQRMLDWETRTSEFERRTELLELLVDGRRATLGEDHPLTVEVLRELDLVREERELSRIAPDITAEQWDQGLWSVIDDLDPAEHQDMSRRDLVRHVRRRYETGE